MNNLSIRSLQGEELLDVLYPLNMYAFHPSPPFQDKAEWAKIVRERKGVTFHALHFSDINYFSGAVAHSLRLYNELNG